MTETTRRNRRRRVETRGERQWSPSSLDDPAEAQGEGRAVGEAAPPGDEVAGGAVPGEWHWTGCDDNVGFGARTARDFMDWRYLRGHDSRDIRSIVMLWNNEAGRRVSTGGSRYWCW